MDYEKKYKEAFEKIQELINKANKQGHIIVRVEDIENSFPELQESEDEEIRQAMINFFKSERIKDGIAVLHFGVNIEKMIAWLEKQGQEHNNKPKFKVGDWITNGRYDKLIVGINSDWTFYMFKDGTSKRIKDVDKKYWLWTIQEANDGDVLCYETKNELRIFIYKNGHVHYHCCYYNGHLTTVDSYFIVEKYLLCYIHPATIKQRDLFFQKIREAGYEWDNKKKELKKMQKFAWSEKDESKVKEIAYFLDTAKVHYASTTALDDCIEWLQSLKQRMT